MPTAHDLGQGSWWAAVLLLGALVVSAGAILPCAGIALADLPPSGTGISTSQTKGVNTGDPVSANSGAHHFSLPLLKLGGPLPLYS